MMMTSVARVKFIKTKVIFMYHTKGVSNQVSSNSDLEIKSYSCSNSSNKMKKKKKKSGKNFLGYKTGQEGDYKSGQGGLQIGTSLGILNRDRDYKSGQKGFQIGPGITNRGRTLLNKVF